VWPAGPVLVVVLVLVAAVVVAGAVGVVVDYAATRARGCP